MKKPEKNIVLIVIIFLAFVSLGFPDGITGVSWPAVRSAFGLPLGNLGIITTLLLCMSAISSFSSGHIIARFGTGRVTFFSAFLTGSALLGYSFSGNFLWILLFTVPLGLGQGAVDSGLNLYVAEHYTSRHMNWLHCFWGVGASVGPLIMTRALMQGNQWRLGYRTVSLIQLTIAAILFFSVVKGLWDTQKSHIGAVEQTHLQNAEIGLSSKGAQILAMFLFFLYAGLEFSVGAWMNSVLIESRHMPVYLAGIASSLFYATIMIGRFLSGFVVNRVGNTRMIRLDMALALAGLICLLTVKNDTGELIGVAMVGLGLASVFPCLMYETPIRFKKQVSDRLIGYQVGAACLGGSMISSGTGMLISRFGLELLFPILILLFALTFAANEILGRGAKTAAAAYQAAAQNT
ncbi:MAG TPA: MFS transporter [Caproiciproducens sp.]|nr:MFS transporter [Caproiciproducens sp.]